MEQILDLDHFDVERLDRVMHCFHNPKDEAERGRAQQALVKFRKLPQAWRKVDAILEQARLEQTKFLGLQILEDLIKFRWRELPPEQRQGIRGYVIKTIRKLSASAELLHKHRLIVQKLNLQIVEVAKHEWPQNWPTFIQELVSSAKSSESLCENNVAILRLLSEEVFDYSQGRMTQAKIAQLKSSMTKEFQAVFKLCLAVLQNAKRPSLLLSTLKTLLGFLNWIPLGYIFETPLVPVLVNKYFYPVPSRVLTLRCLTEIAALSIGSRHVGFFVKLFSVFCAELFKIMPPGVNLPAAYAQGSDNDRKFVHFLVLFLTTMFKTHLQELEKLGQPEAILRCHDLLAKATFLKDDTIFNICLDYWNSFAESLYHDSAFGASSSAAAASSFARDAAASSGQPIFPEDEDDGSTRMVDAAPVTRESSRSRAYQAIMVHVRTALVLRMPKPEEVLIVQDDFGKIIREHTVDTAALGLYKTMRSTLVYLTHLDPQHTQELIVERLKAVCRKPSWTYDELNTLCWAIGSISGALSENDEKQFIIVTIQDLLKLVGATQIKDAKAVIASNIMYIVGQYPRFLRAHWRFLRTVITKLIEFMHELHPGVQDMACDTYLKIARRCRRKFVTPQDGDPPFIYKLLTELAEDISDLRPAQIQVCYEAVGCMIESHPDAKTRAQLIERLMALPNQSWRGLMRRVGQHLPVLFETESANSVAAILKTNERACSAVGQSFSGQMSLLFSDMLRVYTSYTTHVSEAVQHDGRSAIETENLRAIRGGSKEILRLVETFVEKAQEVNTRALLPPLLDSVLAPYAKSHPDARDPGVLSLFTALINRLKESMTPHVPDIFRGVFDPTLAMIKPNYTDYPEHRSNFFALLAAIIAHCFPAVFKIPERHFKLIVESILWGTKHSHRGVSDTALNIVLDLLRKMAKSQAASHFYRSFFKRIFQEIFYVLTDRLHKFGFALQATILQSMILTIETDRCPVPLWNPDQVADSQMTNKRYLRQFLLNLITANFSNVGKGQVRDFVLGLFATANELPNFKNHLRDFLVKLQEFSPDTNEDLHLLYHEEEAAAQVRATRQERERQLRIPGMIAPSLLEDQQMDDVQMHSSSGDDERDD